MIEEPLDTEEPLAIKEHLWWSAVSDLHYTEHGIACTVLFNDGVTVPFHAMAADTMAYGKDIYERAVAGEFGPIAPFVPPSAEEVRRYMPPLSRLQFFLVAMRLNISKDEIRIAISKIADPHTKLVAEIEFDEAGSFNRLNSTFLMITEDRGILPETIDAAWIAAAAD